jgi:RNA polymerase sigma-70 factor (ECF subfamily)
MYIRDHKRKDINDSLTDWQEDEQRCVDFERVLMAEDRSLQSAVDRVTLTRLIKELAPGYRSTLLLHDLLGYEHSEICKIMNIREGTSKSQVHKARQRLRRMLKAA